MGMTIAEKICSPCWERRVRAGELISIPVDMILGNDVAAPWPFRSFEHWGRPYLTPIR